MRRFTGQSVGHKHLVRARVKKLFYYQDQLFCFLFSNAAVSLEIMTTFCQATRLWHQIFKPRSHFQHFLATTMDFKLD